MRAAIRYRELDRVPETDLDPARRKHTFLVSVFQLLNETKMRHTKSVPMLMLRCLLRQKQWPAEGNFELLILPPPPPHPGYTVLGMEARAPRE